MTFQLVCRTITGARTYDEAITTNMDEATALDALRGAYEGTKAELPGITIRECLDGVEGFFSYTQEFGTDVKYFLVNEGGDLKDDLKAAGLI